LAEIKLFDSQPASPGRSADSENWYIEPFTKQTGCQTPGQCDEDCDCGCPYNTMTEVEQLPLIEEIARIFPDEWLAFIVSPEEDDDYEPIHGKLIAHGPNPDEVYDAVNAVLWNQHVYVFFNGNFEDMQTSYGDDWEKSETIAQQAFSNPKQANPVTAPSSESLPDDLIELIYSAIDQLYDTPNLNESIRRLRLARVRADATTTDSNLLAVLDHALDKMESPRPPIGEVIWQLEESLVNLAE
jgi:hypothetical protein